MSVGDYQYVDDNGVEMWVTLPTDLASALSTPSADYSKPYLDSSIAPRYATYRGANGAIRQTAVYSTTAMGTLPATITLSGIVYSLTATRGEVIPYVVNSLLSQTLSIPGPPGPPGTSGGSLVFTTMQQTGNVHLASALTEYVILNFGVLPAGSYMAWFTQIFANNNGPANWLMYIDANSGARYGNTGVQSLSAVDSYTVSGSCMFVADGISNVQLRAFTDTADGYSSYVNCSGTNFGYCTVMQYS